MVICSQEPTTYAEANTTYKLAEVTMAGGDYAVADGDVSGRKLTVSQKTVAGTADGTGNHVALIDTVNSELYIVTPCNTIGISNGVNQDFGAWDWESEDPVAP